jgi:hypothetical protein
MSLTNSGPGQTVSSNLQPITGLFDTAGNLLQLYGPGGLTIPTTIGPTTYANLPSASANPGMEAFVSDWGANGTKVRSINGRWLPMNGQTVLKRMGGAVSGIANTETILAQIQVPAGAIQSGDLIYIRMSANKSGTTDSIQVSLRVGTTGTVSDTAITGLSALSIASTTNVTSGVLFGVRVLSNTSMQKMGMNGTNFGSYSSGSTGVIAAATTGLSDISSNAIWLTMTVKSSGTTDTVGAQELTIIHEAG